MATRAQLAEAADMLPAFAPQRRLSRIRLPFIRPRAQGLAGLPERYRLQMLMLAAERMPGESAEAVAAAGAELADRTRRRIPAALLGAHFEDLDPWFRDHAESIAADADRAVASWRR